MIDSKQLNTTDLNTTERGAAKLTDRVGEQADRKARARGRKNQSPWFGLGMFGLVGWSIALPTVLGTSLGMWLDGRWPGPVSWTLTLLFIGVVLGCANAWYWIRQEQPDDD